MNTAELLREKVRQRRLALQQSLTLSEESTVEPEGEPTSVAGPSWVENVQVQGGQIETTAEVVTEIPENIKDELKKKKKKKLKELRKLPTQSLEERNYHLEVIQHDVEEDEVSSNRAEGDKYHGLLPKLSNIKKPSFEGDGWFSASGEQPYPEVHPSARRKSSPYKTSTPISISSKMYGGHDLSLAEEQVKERVISDFMVENSLDIHTDRMLETNIKIPEEQKGKDQLSRLEYVTKPTEESAKYAVIETHESDGHSDLGKKMLEQDAYDFFTRVWEEEPEYKSPYRRMSYHSPSTSKHTSEIPKIVIDEGLQDEEDESAELLGREYFEQDAEWYITKQVKATYTPFRQRLEKEKASCFYPSSKPVPLELKLPDGREPRNLEEEGFYVGKRPQVLAKNINQLENRLVKQQEMQWFGDDGLVEMLPNPVYDIPSRQVLTEEIEPLLETVYVKASVDISSAWYFNKKKSQERYQLDFDISSLSFTHHPLFSREHVLMSRLLQMCQKYNSILQKDSVIALKQRLKALRAAVNNLKNSISHDLQDSSVTADRMTRMKSYQEDIRQTRKLRDLREAEHKALLKSITDIWNELKNLRASQGYANTSISLTIHEEDMDENAEMEEWNRELIEELKEEKEDYEIMYEKLLQEYNLSLENWKQWNKCRKQASKRQKKREKQLVKSDEDAESPLKDELEKTALNDELILSEADMPKPHPPVKFNEIETLDKLTRNAVLMRRKPGEPKIYIKVDHSGPISPTSQCSKSELQRRHDVSKSKVYFKIMFNDKKVLETSQRNLNQDFTASWGQIFKLQIVQWPRSFRLEIYENGAVVNTQLAQIYLPIPDITESSQNAHLVEHQFSSDQVATFKHDGIGSGVPFRFGNENPSWLLTSGVVRCSLVWGVSEDGTVLAPTTEKTESSLLSAMKGSDPLANLMSRGISNIAKLRQWVQKSHLDPNDPSNTALFKIIKEYEIEKDGLETEDSGYYRLEPLQEEFDFVTMEELENNNRFRLLQLRSQDVPEFRNYQMIPADEKNIPAEVLEQLQRKPESNERPEIKDGMEVHKDRAQKLMKKVREEVVKRFYAAQHQRTLEDIVIEEKVPNIGTLGFSLLKLLQRKRPLYPVRKERKKVTGQTVASTDVKIMVTILHAMNVPVRTDIDPVRERMQKRSSKDAATGYESQVRPFVEVMFQRIAVKTNVAEGPHPTWNQELHLPFRAPNDDYSPANLETVKDSIYFNVFDEVIVDLLEDDKDRESVVYERLERRWLGNLKIPFTTMYLNSKIEGTFRVNVPPVLLGYENEPRPWLMGGLSDDTANHTYLSFFITIEPCLQLPEVFRDKYDIGEPERILREVEKWQQSVIPRYPERFIKVMIVDVTGKWIFISRFLHALRPPEEFLVSGEDSPEIMELLARFVSLIPTVSDSIIYPGLCDIWSTSDQFLQMLTGDEEEHAVLLCNFFLHLGKKTMLLLGAGIPEGPTAYVLTWENSGDLWVWNATTGDHFSVRDNHSPLQRVGCLISPDNIWANVQKNDHPARINFDVSKSSDWKPFFSRSLPNPGLISVQPEVLTYIPTDSEFVQKLQENLKKSLQESIMKWRRRLCTSWNSYCNQVLYKILTRLERNAGRTASMDSLQELEQILSSHKMNGFPLTMPYTDIDAVIEAVFATGVHLTEDKNAEFGLAVYIHPYPCSVLAIWVYVAVLTSRR